MVVACNIVIAVPNLVHYSQTTIFIQTFTFARFGMTIIEFIECVGILQATPFLAQCQACGLGTVPETLSPIHKTRTHPALGVRNLAKVKLSLKLIAREYCPLLRGCEGLQLFFTLFNKPCCFCCLVSIVLLFKIKIFSCAVAGIKSLQIGHIYFVLIRRGNAA